MMEPVWTEWTPSPVPVREDSQVLPVKPVSMNVTHIMYGPKPVY